MALFSGPRKATERRSMTMPDAWHQAFGARDFASVDAGGLGALQSIAVDASIDLICSLASELPLHVFRGEGVNRKRLATPENLRDPGDSGQGLEDWVYCLVGSWLYRGNVYGREIEWDPRTGRARRIELFHPDDVRPQQVDGTVSWFLRGQPVERPDLFVHRRVNPVAGRVQGASVIERHAMQIGTSVSAAMFGAQWFRDGAHPSGMLHNTEAPIDQEQAKVVKARWMAMFRGTREPVVMGKGWEWKQLQINPNESQFLETQRFTEAQCARMFGPAVAETLGYETGGSMTYANVVDRRSDLLAFSLNRWLNRAERVLTALLPEPQYVRFDRDALLQSATLARYEAHAKALQNRWKTVNEVRDDEDMPRVEWGDEPNGLTPAGGVPGGDSAGV